MSQTLSIRKNGSPWGHMGAGLKAFRPTALLNRWADTSGNRVSSLFLRLFLAVHVFTVIFLRPGDHFDFLLL